MGEAEAAAGEREEVNRAAAFDLERQDGIGLNEARLRDRNPAEAMGI